MNTAKADAQELLDALLPFAQQMLQQYRAFYPFGGRMASNGVITHVGATDDTEYPGSQAMIGLIHTAFRNEAQAGKLRTCGILYDVRTAPPGQTEKQDAIAAALDHVSGYSIVVIFPYRFDEAGQLQLDPSFAVQWENGIFGEPPASGTAEA
jgi:hypothetical protein